MRSYGICSSPLKMDIKTQKPGIRDSHTMLLLWGKQPEDNEPEKRKQIEGKRN